MVTSLGRTRDPHLAAGLGACTRSPRRSSIPASRRATQRARAARRGRPARRDRHDAQSRARLRDAALAGRRRRRHARDDVLFTPGSADRGVGLEQLAEDGNAAPLARGADREPARAAWSRSPRSPRRSMRQRRGLRNQVRPTRSWSTPRRATRCRSRRCSACRTTGSSHRAPRASRCSTATSRAAATSPPRSCSTISARRLDEELAIGPNTAPQQPAPNTGRADRVTTVREVTVDRYGVPSVTHIRVTLSPQ